ncbi:hypothetical protein A3A36_01365 [Candidatus Kaiserbacteria bacterium RIFCSPLOWO2_01_FULL_52_12b]|uniref:DUF4383 domain-containing protein n=1 Tax=Candidatus Kaiserbacteria bacterium RIFCSPLOWO2_01_FULL_52_12b TaxID=1798509 RepID=A0A1F6EXM9_9BACT|nr:MAG: hypothetical protein A3A36_01365 [Candidatus Kaiserbacteria bacterium RIFCSPLOWO2_01_FULL_52_12b]
MMKTSTIIFGVILVLLGFLGFVSNPLIGADALFVADAVHNFIHIVFGVILLAIAFWVKEKPLLWLKSIGAIVFLSGLIDIFFASSTGGSLFGIAYTNRYSDWLHLIAGLAILSVGIYGRDDA